MNRVLTTRMADLHFAATEGAAHNLESQGVDHSRVFVTGNPGNRRLCSSSRMRWKKGRCGEPIGRSLICERN
ncbi:MAG: hypothetical protein DMG57_12435 [Acidobacteria bacterium]|nr:MAG: hypothetical protein DMG57_12435 [Acidobacteriota bacterium]